nr:MAG TPA: hypothetical protein [Caudoviricetes sp.]
MRCGFCLVQMSCPDIIKVCTFPAHSEFLIPKSD